MQRYPYQNQRMCSPQMDEHEFGVVFITYSTFDVDWMEFCMFTLGTILYNKVVPAM